MSRVILTRRKRPSYGGWMAARTSALAGALVLMLLGAIGNRAVGAASGPGPSEIARIIGAYLSDPRANRQALLDLARQVDLPANVQLAVADAYFRAGRPRAARRVLTSVAAEAEMPWAGWAEAGLGWVALVRGDLADARVHYEHLAEGDWKPTLAQVVLGLLDAREGKTEQAAATLDRLGLADATDPALRDLSLLGAAYAFYWGGNYTAAVVEFEQTAARNPGGRLADDARYGAAMATYNRGDHAAGIAALRMLAMQGTAASSSAPVTPALVRLEPWAVFGVSWKRYRDAPLARPEDQLTALLDGDGAALARAALRMLVPDEVPVQETTARIVRPAAAPRSPERPVVADPARQLGQSATTAATAHSSGFPRMWLLLLGVLVALALVFAFVRRRGSSGRAA